MPNRPDKLTRLLALTMHARIKTPGEGAHAFLKGFVLGLVFWLFVWVMAR